MQLTKRQGFTLVEMLVVLTILSVLMLTVVISVGRVMERGHAAQIETQMAQLKAAAQMAQSDGISDFSQRHLVETGYLHQVILPPTKDMHYVIQSEKGQVEVILEKGNDP